MGCPKIPAYWGWPSIMTISRPDPPLNPRSEILPAAPPDTPYPITPREVTKRPGTRSVNTGSSDGCMARSICVRSTTDTVCDRWRTSVSWRVPVTTTSPISYTRSPFSVSLSCAHAARTAKRAKTIKTYGPFICKTKRLTQNRIRSCRNAGYGRRGAVSTAFRPAPS